jgi:hypothetical protein
MCRGTPNGHHSLHTLTTASQIQWSTDDGRHGQSSIILDRHHDVLGRLFIELCVAWHRTMKLRSLPALILPTDRPRRIRNDPFHHTAVMTHSSLNFNLSYPTISNNFCGILRIVSRIDCLGIQIFPSTAGSSSRGNAHARSRNMLGVGNSGINARESGARIMEIRKTCCLVSEIHARLRYYLYLMRSIPQVWRSNGTFILLIPRKTLAKFSASGL